MLNVKKLSAGLIAAQIFLGSFCIMDVGVAASEPADNDMETVHEMAMSPMLPMSPADCDGCITITRPRHHAGMQGMKVPCGDGSCLMEHIPSMAVVTQSPRKEAASVGLPPVFAIPVQPSDGDIPPQGSTDPPFFGRSPTKTTVLRL